MGDLFAAEEGAEEAQEDLEDAEEENEAAQEEVSVWILSVPGLMTLLFITSVSISKHTNSIVYGEFIPSLMIVACKTLRWSVCGRGWWRSTRRSRRTLRRLRRRQRR